MLSEDDPRDVLLSFVDNFIVAGLPGGQGMIDLFTDIVEAALGAAQDSGGGSGEGSGGGSGGGGSSAVWGDFSSLGPAEGEQEISKPASASNDGSGHVQAGPDLFHSLLGGLNADLDL